MYESINDEAILGKNKNNNLNTLIANNQNDTKKEGTQKTTEGKKLNLGTIYPKENKTAKTEVGTSKRIYLDQSIKTNILTLIKYHKYKLYLKEKIDQSKNDIIFNEVIYLVDIDSINKIKDYYNYKDIIGKFDINKEIFHQNLEERLKNINMLDVYIDKQKNQKNKLILKEGDNFKPNIEFKNVGNEKIIYPKDFDILNEDIYKDLVKNGGIKCLCAINSGKIIIQYFGEDNNKFLFMLLIGNLDITNNKCNIEMIFNYNNPEYLQNHFDRLCKEKYKEFINKNCSFDSKTLYEDNNLNKYKQIGMIIFIDNMDNSNINTKRNILEPKNKNKSIGVEDLNYIKFLLNLHFFNERLNYKLDDTLIENPNRQKLYLINKNIINKFKDLYKYSELEKILNKNEIQKIIKEYKKSKKYIPEIQIQNLVDKIINLIDSTYYNLIENIQIKDIFDKLNYKTEKNIFNGNPELYYYSDCYLINENMLKLIKDQILNEVSTLCTLGEKAVFLIFDKIINIGQLDNNDIFIPKAIIKLKKENSINSIFNQIKKFNLNLYLGNLSQFYLDVNEQNEDYEEYIITNENKIINEEIELKLTEASLLNKPPEQYQTNKLRTRPKRENIYLKNLILFYMDYIDLITKTKNPFKNNYINNKFGYYYLLNYNWFMKYIEKSNLMNVFKYLMKNNIIGKIKDYDKLSLEQKEEAIREEIYEFDNNLINFKNFNIDKNELKNDSLFHLQYYCFNPRQDINIKYYQGFFLIKEETYKSIIKEFNFNNNIMNYCYYCYIGDNSICIQLINGDKSTLQVGHISKNNYGFSTDLFLYFNSKQEFEEGINILIETGYKKFWKFNLILNSQNDFYSPIFNYNEKIIGNAFIYNKTNFKIDYSNLFINDNLKSLVLFYMENEILKKTIMTNDINKIRKYYLININWLNEFKKIYLYNNLINELTKNSNINNEINKLVNNMNIDITEKKLYWIIKNLPSNINSYYNKNNFPFINNISFEPNNDLYQFERNNKLGYFNNFEIISEQMYNRLFCSQSNDIRLSKLKDSYINCIFYEGIIMLELSKYVSGLECYVIENGYINNNNIFIPSYILTYKDGNKFMDHLRYIKQTIGIKNFYSSLRFNNGCSLPLFDSKNYQIGTIYNLNIKFKDMNPATNFNNKNHQKFFQMIPFNNNFQNQNIIPNQNQINNNNNRPPAVIPTINTFFPVPPLMGLKNVGATCYMNATLQCFSQIDKLVNYFKFRPHVDQVINKYESQKKSCLTKSFKELIENLWPSNYNYIKPEYVGKNSNNSYFAPYKFKEKISEMNELFKGVKANDSKDLVNFIVMTLHEEMNKANKNDQNNNFVNNVVDDQTNKQRVITDFFQEFQRDNKSIISDLFYAQTDNITQCQKCGIMKYNLQTYFFIIFPLEEVRKFIIEYKKNQFIQTYGYMQNVNPLLFQQMVNNFMFNNQNQNSVNIYNCFEYNQKIDYFNGENAMYCNRCQHESPSSYVTKLYTGPQILIIILNRGVGIQYKVKLEFTETLNLANYIEQNNTGCFYNLIGVVTHMGESGASGHFIAYCKSPIDKKWYRYNDDLVTEVFNFKQEIMDYAMPYILFFQKIQE